MTLSFQVGFLGAIQPSLLSVFTGIKVAVYATLHHLAGVFVE